MSDDEAVIRTTPGAFDHAFGLDITITPEVEHWIKEVEAKDKAEVRVSARGQARTFTFDEFLSRLGFE